MSNSFARATALLALTLTSAAATAAFYPVQIIKDQEIQVDGGYTCILKTGGVVEEVDNFGAYLEKSLFGKIHVRYNRGNAPIASAAKIKECSNQTDLVLSQETLDQVFARATEEKKALEQEILNYSPASMANLGTGKRFRIDRALIESTISVPQDTPLRLIGTNDYCHASPNATLTLKAVINSNYNDRARIAFYEDLQQNIALAMPGSCLHKTVVLLDHKTDYAIYQARKDLKERLAAQAAIKANGLADDGQSYHYLNSFLRREVMPVYGPETRPSCRLFEESFVTVLGKVSDELSIAKHEIDPALVKDESDCGNGELVVVDTGALTLREDYLAQQKKYAEERAAAELERQRLKEEARVAAEQRLLSMRGILDGNTVSELKGFKIGDLITLTAAVTVKPVVLIDGKLTAAEECIRAFGVGKIEGFDSQTGRALISWKQNEDTLRYLLIRTKRTKDKRACADGSLTFKDLE